MPVTIFVRVRRLSGMCFLYAAIFTMTVVTSGSPAHAAAFDPKAYPNLVIAKSVVEDLQVELKYATTDNFTKTNLYGEFKDCYLQKEAAEKLKAADKKLKELNKDLAFLAYDCARPRSVQITMWNIVKDTPQKPYVADPYSKNGSIHNYGCAVDLTVTHKKNGPLDMGTKFDFFGQLAEPRHEINLMSQGKLSSEQMQNRLTLRLAMVAGGFTPISNEWWHFDCATPEETHAKFKLIE